MADDKAAATEAAVDAKQAVDADSKPSADVKKNGGPTMQVKVYAPFKIYFEGEAVSLTALNETGPFDILPKHRNFLCMLIPCDLIVRTPYEEKVIKIARALMYVKSEKVTVFVDV